MPEVFVQLGHFSSVNAVAFSPDGKLALSGSRDSTTRLWNVQTGKEVAKMVAFDNGEWITITPEDYYTASLNGAKHINVRVGDFQVYSIDQYEALCHRPNIVELVLKLGDSQKAIAQATKATPTNTCIIQPPKVWFITPKNGYETKSAKLNPPSQRPSQNRKRRCSGASARCRHILPQPTAYHHA